jgi:signal transduction histidine kinase
MQRDGPLDTARVKGRTLVEVRPNSRGARRFHECVLQVARTGNRSEVYFRLDFPLSDSEAWHHVRFVAERDQRGEIVSVLAIGRDVTEHRHLERALLEVTNREQLRLGSELHDGLGQELTGLSLTASALAAAARRGRPPTAKSLKYIADIAAGAINTCREIARGLTPLATHNGDLVGALRNLARVQRHSGGVPVTFECTGEARLNVGDTQVDHLYRIAQEGLTNARKHAKAGAIFIGIDIQPHQVRLSIVDDGIGMPSISDGNGRLGLTTMRYRASLIGGQLTVDSLTGGGTRLVCQCPQEPEPPGTPN